MTDINCHFCNGNAQAAKGIIYVRYQVKEKWENVPMCPICWTLERQV